MKLPKTELQRLLRFTVDLAVGAGNILKRGFRKQLKVHFKGRINPVTDYDLKSEQFIRSRITSKYPAHTILAEEGNNHEGESGFRWVIDPLDGTVNYAHGFPIYCVSIALELEGRPAIGVVYDPEHDELFSGARGLGARLNQQLIRVSKTRRLQRALLATGFAYNIATARRNNLGLFARMARRAQGIRRPGSAAIDLCWLACGRTDGFWELDLQPWDTAAALVIVEEAAGKVTRIDGSPYSIFAPDILATNSRLHPAMMSALSGHA